MISSIEWIPAGVADPHPKKYELSSAEEELLTLMEEKGSLNDHIAHVEAAIQTNKSNAPNKSSKAENSLPADLRMDEYSSDEDDCEDEDFEGAVNDHNDDNAMAGQVLGTSAASVVGDMMDDNDSEGKEPDKDLDKDGRGIDVDSDDDEDLDDIPDTREFEPIDVEGLEAMGLSHVGMGNESAFMNGLDRNDEDDDSDADDVLITADDALVVVAKAEDVRNSVSLHPYVACPRSLSTISVHWSTNVQCRTLLLSRYTSTTKRKEISMCITTFHCRPFRYAWRMDKLVEAE
jgi:hypothetical protein